MIQKKYALLFALTLFAVLGSQVGEAHIPCVHTDCPTWAPRAQYQGPVHSTFHHYHPPTQHHTHQQHIHHQYIHHPPIHPHHTQHVCGTSLHTTTSCPHEFVHTRIAFYNRHYYEVFGSPTGIHHYGVSTTRSSHLPHRSRQNTPFIHSTGRGITRYY